MYFLCAFLLLFSHGRSYDYYTCYPPSAQLETLGKSRVSGPFFPGEGLADLFGVIAQEIDTLYPTDKNAAVVWGGVVKR